jgi:hypothetical protein
LTESKDSERDRQREKERKGEGIDTEAKRMPVALLIKQQFEKRVYRNISVKI